MGFWERLRDWFGRTPVPKSPPTSTADASRPQPTFHPVTKPTDGSTLPEPGTAIDIFSLLFSQKDKHTTVMLNSISLSSDMKTLYLIDNGRAIPFDLTVKEGVLIGMLGGQLVVATAVNLPTASDTPVGTSEPTTDGEVAGGRRPVPLPVPELEKFTFKAGEDSQYTFSYNAKNKALTVIGLDDIIINLEAPDETECRDKVFKLDGKNILNVRWSGDELIVLKVPSKR